MRRLPACALWLAVLAASAVTEPGEAPDADLTVLEGLDLATVRAGDWVEMDSRLTAPGGHEERWSSRTECMEAGDGTLTLRSNRGVTGRRKGQWQVRVRRDGGAFEALWWVPEGGEPVAVEIPQARPKRGPRLTGKGTVTRETITIAGRELACLRLACDVTETSGSRKETYRWTRWVSAEIPIPRFVKRGGAGEDGIEWDGEVPGSAGLARMTYEYPDGEEVVSEATGWGRAGAGEPADRKR